MRIVKSGELDFNTAQTPGMTRAAAINHAKAGAQKLWAGTVSVAPNAKTGAHHHGHLESIIYVVKGRARMRWGERLEFTAEADPGDFIFVPPYVPHQEINALPGDPLECVVVRSDQEAVVVNLDIARRRRSRRCAGSIRTIRRDRHDPARGHLGRGLPLVLSRGGEPDAGGDGAGGASLRASAGAPTSSTRRSRPRGWTGRTT